MGFADFTEKHYRHRFFLTLRQKCRIIKETHMSQKEEAWETRDLKRKK